MESRTESNLSSSGIIAPEQVMAVGRKLMELRPLVEVFEAILDACTETMLAETAMILLKDESGNLKVAAQRYTGQGEPRGLEGIATSFLNRAVEQAEADITESAVDDPRFSGTSSMIMKGIQAAAIAPLLGFHSIMGALYLDSRSNRTRFQKKNIYPLMSLGAFAALAIENARRYEAARRSKTAEGATLLVGSSPVMDGLFAMIGRLATSALPVLITGESGTGKELVAREIHARSSRADKPFMALYCGNVSSQLFESELFGHKKGSFTGATADKPGLVEEAVGGSLFLDEVADIPTDLQAKLLRFLQEGEYRAVGDTRVKKADVRIITATNKDLQKEVREGRFREDLYYRLYILPVVVPPLRERLSDVPFLVRHFIDKHQPQGKSMGISPAAMRKLMNYNWPGNVRELENAVARAMVVAAGERIEPDDVILPEVFEAHQGGQDWSWKFAEKQHVLKVISLLGGNRKEAAHVLGISRRYLFYKLKEWGVTKEEKDEG